MSPRVPTFLFIGLLGLLGLGLGISAASASGRYPAFPEDPSTHVWEKVADGVYAFISPVGITPLVSGNSLIVIGHDAVLVVDTGQFPSLARAEIAAIKRLTPLPVRFIVNTHWHPDHWTGNGEFRRAYPGVVIIATQNTRTLAQARGAQDVLPEYAKKVQAYIDQTLAPGPQGDAKPMAPGERTYLEMARVQFRSFGRELASVSLVFPDVVFTDSLDLDLGKRLVQVRFLGRGNTGGDAVVYVPDAKVMAAGDLLVSPFPYGTGSFYGEWLAALRKLLTFDVQILVPGHGAVEHDHTYLLRVIRLLEQVQSEVAAGMHAGLSLKQIQQQVKLTDAMDELCAPQAFKAMCENSFRGNFVEPAIARTYQELKDGPLASEL